MISFFKRGFTKMFGKGKQPPQKLELEEQRDSAPASINNSMFLSGMIEENDPDTREYEEQIKKEISKGLFDIKDSLKTRRKSYKVELAERNQQIGNENKNLRKITKYYSRWRKIQRKTVFFHIYRNSIKSIRTNGFLGIKSKDYWAMSSEQKRNRCAVYPDNRFLKIHITVMVLLMAYLVIVLPLELAFDFDEASNLWSYINMAITGYFVIDIILSFFMVYSIENVIVDQNWPICKNYLFRWFIVDLISVFPFEYLFESTGSSLNFKKFLRLPRLFRLMNTMFQNSESKRASRSFLSSKLSLLFSSANAKYVGQSVLVALIFIHMTSSAWCWLLTVEGDHRNWLFR